MDGCKVGRADSTGVGTKVGSCVTVVGVLLGCPVGADVGRADGNMVGVVLG